MLLLQCNPGCRTQGQTGRLPLTAEKKHLSIYTQGSVLGRWAQRSRQSICSVLAEKESALTREYLEHSCMYTHRLWGWCTNIQPLRTEETTDFPLYITVTQASLLIILCAINDLHVLCSIFSLPILHNLLMYNIVSKKGTLGISSSCLVQLLNVLQK